MRDRDLLLAGGVGLGLLLLLRQTVHGRVREAVAGALGAGSSDQLDPELVALTAGWRWPVETLDAGRFPDFADGQARRLPEVSDGMSVRDTGPHDGVDIMYKRTRRRLPKLPDSSWLYDMPDGIRALATARGKVSVSKDIGTGGWVKVWHRGNLATQYLHLAERFVAPGDVVEAGQPLGVVGFNPSGYKLRHLHFELLRDGKTPIDPEPYMPGWTHTDAPADAPAAAPAA